MHDADVLVAGEALIDFVPETTGDLSSVESFTRRAGGAPANVAVALARLGAPPLFWTRIGADPFGDHLLSTLREAGIPDRYVTRDRGAQTGLAFLATTAEGRSFTFYRDASADTRFERGTVDDDTLEAVAWVHLGGVALSREPARSALLALAESASDHGCTVSVDPNVRPEVWTNTTELQTVTGWLLEEADVLFATPDELETLGFEGADEAALGQAASDAGPHTVFLTLGADGAYAIAGEESPWSGTATHDGYDVDAVDETGAGDAFVAGAIRSLLDGDSLAESLRVGNAAGALTTTRRGAIAAAPDRPRLEELRSEQADDRNRRQ